MPYASGRSFFDADSHIMERPDFLRDFAEEPLRERIPRLSFEGQGKTATDWDELTRNPGHTPERVAEMVALGDGLIAGPKGFLALGAFNREERTQALDQLGFHRQLVFSTMSSMVSLHHPDPEILYAGAASHNRAMANFCEA